MYSRLIFGYFAATANMYFRTFAARDRPEPCEFRNEGLNWTIPPVSVNGSGQAQFLTPGLGVGSYSITATYDATTNSGTST